MFVHRAHYTAHRLNARLAGAEEHIAAAQAKRDRKNTKRVKDAQAQAIGDRRSREIMESGGFANWFADYYSPIPEFMQLDGVQYVTL